MRFCCALVALLMTGLPLPSLADPGTVTLDVRDVALVDVLRLVAAQAHLSILPDATVPSAHVTLRMTRVPVRTVLDALEAAYGLSELATGGVVRIATAASLATSLDPAANVQTATLPVLGASAAALIPALTAALPSAVVVAAPSGRALVVAGSPVAIERARALVAGLTSDAGIGAVAPTLIRLNYLSAPDAQRLLASSGYLEAGTTIAADEARDQLFVRGSAAAVERIQAAVALLDRAQPQVTFEVQVLDLTPQNDSTDIGILWGGTDSSGKVTTGSSFSAFANKLLPLNATLNALIAEGKASVLARPSVAVSNGETGKILVGSQYPLQITNGGLVGGSSVQFLQIGVQLQIKPQVGADGSILTDLTTTFSEITGIEPVSQYPIVGTRTVNSVIRVRDGEPIVLAGLFSDVRSETVRRVPLLSNIPIFGQVFRNRETSVSRDEIVFAIRPHLGVSPER